MFDDSVDAIEISCQKYCSMLGCWYLRLLHTTMEKGNQCSLMKDILTAKFGEDAGIDFGNELQLVLVRNKQERDKIRQWLKTLPSNFWTSKACNVTANSDKCVYHEIDLLKYTFPLIKVDFVEAHSWIVENMPYQNFQIYSRFGSDVSVAFKRKEDAVSFKMVFGEYV